MPALSATCENCGNVFPSLFGAYHSTAAGFYGNSETCPRCGGIARVQEGTFDATGSKLFLHQAYEAIQEAGLSKDELSNLREILRNAQAQKTSAGEVAASIQEAVPAAANLSKLLSPEAGVISQHLSLLVALLIPLLTALLSLYPLPAQLPQKIINQIIINNNQQVVSNTDNNLAVQRGTQTQPERPTKHKKIMRPPAIQPGRNDPCPCNSGRKWKYCHGGTKNDG